MAIDMLIGSDYYWDLTTGETIRGEGGPVAIHTKSRRNDRISMPDHYTFIAS